MRNYQDKLFTVLFSIIAALLVSSSNLAQSTNPDAPTPLKGGTIIGESTGGVSDKKTYYYTFNVKPGTLTLTTDIDPVKGTGGGVVYWTYLDTKFKQLRYDAYAAQGSPTRKVNDAKITVKRKIILKLEVEGQMSYKLRFSGNGLVQ